MCYNDVKVCKNDAINSWVGSNLPVISLILMDYQGMHIHECILPEYRQQTLWYVNTVLKVSGIFMKILSLLIKLQYEGLWISIDNHGSKDEIVIRVWMLTIVQTCKVIFGMGCLFSIIDIDIFSSSNGLSAKQIYLILKWLMIL